MNSFIMQVIQDSSKQVHCWTLKFAHGFERMNFVVYIWVTYIGS